MENTHERIVKYVASFCVTQGAQGVIISAVDAVRVLAVNNKLDLEIDALSLSNVCNTDTLVRLWVFDFVEVLAAEFAETAAVSEVAVVRDQVHSL